MAQKFSNNAQSVLPASLASAATSFSVKSGEGGRFPVLGAGDFFMVTVVDASGTVEIMKCTARSGDTLTVERAQEGTTAADFPAGSLVQHRMTAGGFTDEISRIESKADEALNTAYLRRGVLPSDTTHNLNDWGISQVGIWYQGSPTWASSAQNYPAAVAGVLEVLPRTGGRAIQRYSQFPGGLTYVRSESGTVGTWSSWERLDTVSERNSALTNYVTNGALTSALANYALKANLEWISKPICQPFPLWDHMPGCPIPPTDNPNFRFIKLTAGDAYNDGVLINESVTGTGPLVQATAEINLAGSPLNGATVHLINTEIRFLRAGVSGTLQDDAFQGHKVQTISQYGRTALSGSQDANGTGLRSPNTWAGPAAGLTDDGTNGTPRTANETRGKNIQATYYMRIM